MEYFVSIENTAFYHWQIELMLESFNLLNLQNQLLVALAESTQPLHLAFQRNLSNHKRIYGHENIGDIRGFKPLNEFYSLLWACQYSMISQPFVFLSPDMVLRRPIENRFHDDGIPEIVMTPNPFLTVEQAGKEIGPFWDWFKKDKKELQENWLPFGGMTIFNNVPVWFFERLVMFAETLCLRQLLEKNEISPQTSKLAWALVLNDFVGQIRIRGDYTFTDTMLGNSNSPIIFYEHGLPPVFNKTQFTYQPPGYVAFGDPFEILASHAPTPNAHFISNLAKANLDARK